MAQAIERQPADALVRSEALERAIDLARVNWEALTYVGLLATAAIMRLWDLGSRAMHHDESLHALYSWYLYVGRGYQHDPMMHGPFQFHANTGLFFLFGDSDFTARVLYVLFGTALVLLPVFLRDSFIGRRGALLAAALLTVSPTMFYYSRFARNDILMAVFTLGLVIAIFRYFERQDTRYLVLASAMMSLGFATKETHYITVAVFGSFFTFLWIRNLAFGGFKGLNPGAYRGDPVFSILILLGTLTLPVLSAFAKLTPLVAIGQEPTSYAPLLTNLWFLAAVVGLAGIAGFQYYRTGRAKVETTLVIGGAVATLILALIARAAGPNLGLLAIPGIVTPWVTTPMIFSQFVIVGGLFALTAAIGLWWNRSAWPTYAAVYYGIFVLLYTTFFTNLPGLGSGIWGSLSYWLDQQEVMRGGQPWYYYLLLVPIYEFLPVALALIGLGYFAVTRRGFSLFNLFLVYWLVAGTGAYSKAGEKMPWLAVHVALPLILLAASTVGALLAEQRLRRYLSWQAVGSGLLFAIGLLLLGSVGGVFATPGSVVASNLNRAIFLAVSAGLVLVAGGLLGRRLGRGGLLSVGGFAFSGLLLLLTVRAGVTAVYKNGDVATEMLVYTQSSPDITRLNREIGDISMRTTGGYDLKVTVDSTSGFTWPWAWYLRNYKSVDYPAFTVGSVPTGDVVLVHANNVDKMRPFLGEYTSGQRYRHRWWFPEDYKTPIEWIAAMQSPLAAQQRANESFTFGDVVQATFSDTGFDVLWRYLINRDLGKPLGSEDAYFFVRRSIAGAETASLVGPSGQPSGPAVAAPQPAGQQPGGQAAVAPPASAEEYLAKRVALQPDQVIGRRGTGRGEFADPKGVATDGSGNIYVLDTGNNRIQRIDTSGQVVAVTGRAGALDGEFQEPWGIAVAPNGEIWVADTWNHRIQRFSPNLQYLGKFGEFGEAGTNIAANPGKFYGPRSIAFLQDGTVLVTDTGNKRIQRFQTNGQFVAAYGGTGTALGQFQEPVGITTAPDGTVLVADTWNRRVQRFDANFRPIGAFALRGWESAGIINKPYLTVDELGSIYLTDPENHRVLRFNAEGQLLAVIGSSGSEPGRMNLPIGIAVDPFAGLVVVESGNNRVQRFALVP